MSTARPLLRISSGAPHYLLSRFSFSRKLARRHCAHGLCMRKCSSGASHSCGFWNEKMIARPFLQSFSGTHQELVLLLEDVGFRCPLHDRSSGLPQELLTTCSRGSHYRGSLPAAIVPMDCACVNAFQDLPFLITQPAITACITHRVARSLRHTAYCQCMRDTACNTKHAIRACNNMHAMQCMQHTACHHS